MGMISKIQMAKELDGIIKNAIREDIGPGDYSSLACIPEDARGKAKLLVKESGINFLAKRLIPEIISNPPIIFINPDST